MASEHMDDVRDSDVSAAAASRALRILSGAHRDAEIALARNELLVIGAHESCDVCLSDPGLAARHAALAAHADGYSLRRLDGAVNIDGRDLDAAACELLHAGSVVSLGDSEVRLCIGTAPPGPRSTEQSAVLADTSIEDMLDATASSHPSPSPSTKSSSRASLWVKVPVLAVAGLIVVGITVQQLQPSRAAAASESTESTRVAAPTGAEIAQQVREVFRANGYEAEITELGQGRMRVGNLDADNPQVQQVAELVRNDVRLLVELQFTPVADIEPPAAAAGYAQRLPGNLRPVVTEDFSYIAAPDNARYFVGSVLPSGHTIRRIASQGMQVDRKGRISWVGY